jgi:hypothetical protein
MAARPVFGEEPQDDVERAPRLVNDRPCFAIRQVARERRVWVGLAPDILGSKSPTAAQSTKRFAEALVSPPSSSSVVKAISLFL